MFWHDKNISMSQSVSQHAGLVFPGTVSQCGALRRRGTTIRYNWGQGRSDQLVIIQLLTASAAWFIKDIFDLTLFKPSWTFNTLYVSFLDAILGQWISDWLFHIFYLYQPLLEDIRGVSEEYLEATSLLRIHHPLPSPSPLLSKIASTSLPFFPL